MSSKLLFRAPTLAVGLHSLAVILGGAFLAFWLTISEYLLVTHTSGMTLSVAGIFKELCQLSIAAEINHDRWGVGNFLGLVICMVGISIHVVNKTLREQESSREDAANKEMAAVVALINEDGFESDSDSEEIIFESSLDDSRNSLL